jgi:hypothetical protein
MNVSIELHLRAFIIHQQDDGAYWPLVAEFDSYYGGSEATQSTCFLAIHGTDLLMSFLHKQTE